MSQVAATGSEEPTTSKLRLGFEEGTGLVEGLSEDDTPGLPGVKFDHRTRRFRAEAIWYRSIMEHLLAHEIPFVDNARDYVRVKWKIRVEKEAFPHQTEGLAAWWDDGR